ncbi:hypothetical protein KSB_29160 [Ktedonobacter robiniae]|uniref:Resolvase HTH domain-containing protein n=1 Tax=Ktedonobacter robiniae TaxID=2778365 RepID=A0ABQ3UNZ1_9CHLR|nr:hypothetical protein KSB_29160 [Ktedonobacter robiniae]
MGAKGGRTTNHRSHLSLIPIEKVFSGHNDILVSTPKSSADYAPFEQTIDTPTGIPVSQRRPGPDAPSWKIPGSEWSNVIRRVVENQEPLRKVASDYGVSHETVRRVINAAQKRIS